jgi:hypothetical protein
MTNDILFGLVGYEMPLLQQGKRDFYYGYQVTTSITIGAGQLSYSNLCCDDIIAFP